MPRIVSINRAPVLTLWAAIVAERLGFDWHEALSFGKAVAGLAAQAKGRRLGIFKPQEAGAKKAKAKKRGEEYWIELCGRAIPAKNTEDGVRAVNGDKAIEPAGVERYLHSKFGEDFDDVVTSLRKLAKALSREELAERAFSLYERFRPKIPSGERGWGAKGELDLNLIESLAE